MLRLFCNAVRHRALTTVAKEMINIPRLPTCLSVPRISFSTLNNTPLAFNNNDRSILSNANISIIASQIVPSRSLTKFSLTSGKRKAVKAVLRRFYRLDWGGWIRTRAGRGKKLWKKSPNLKRKLKQHVFCNGTQSRLLDSMVTNFWRKPKYYVEDPYEPYHQREEFVLTRKRPIVR